MTSLFESAMMLDALSGDLDREFPGIADDYREAARKDPEKWKWSIAEADRRRKRP